MEIDRCTKDDFDQILEDVADFWGSDRSLHLHHPIFLYELGGGPGRDAVVMRKALQPGRRQ